MEVGEGSATTKAEARPSPQSKVDHIHKICDQMKWPKPAFECKTIDGPPSYFQCVLTLTCPYDDAGVHEDAAPANEKGKEKENEEPIPMDQNRGELGQKIFPSLQQATGKKAAKEEAAEHALKFLAEQKIGNAEKALQSMNIEWNQTLKYHELFEKGDENHLLEFKGGKQPEPQQFGAFLVMFKGEKDRPPMGKYLCAFRNALQHNGGHARICYGIFDRGEICGVVFNEPQKQKDDVRKLFYHQVKDFYPALTGKDCSLEFIPVVDAPLERATDVAYVVIVSAFVRKRNPSAIELYWWRGDAYTRLEGSATRFTPQQIEQHYLRKAYAGLEEWAAAQKAKNE